jgi:hypothetical protein
VEVPNFHFSRAQGARQQGGRVQRDHERDAAAAAHPGRDPDVVVAIGAAVVVDVRVAFPVQGQDILGRAVCVL